MQLTVLVDNNTIIDRYYKGEPALSFFIQDTETKVLFDTGYSNVLLENAKSLSIDLSQPMNIVISHGHNDHTRGLLHLNDAGFLNNKNIIAHNACFEYREENNSNIGSPISKTELSNICSLQLSDKPLKISENLIFLGEIPSLMEFENREAIGKTWEDSKPTHDYVKDDSALCYKSSNGLFIITGCSHSGICNIIEYAKQVCNETRIAGVIGGFHLFEVNQRLEKTVDYFMKNNIKFLYPCHCVSFKAKSYLNSQIAVHEVGVGNIYTIS